MSNDISPRPFRTIAWIVLVCVVGAGSYIVGTHAALSSQPSSSLSANAFTGMVRGIGSRAPKNVSKDVEMTQFWDLWDTLKAKYYKQPVNDKTLFYGAMTGAAASLGDPYTVFFPPTEATNFMSSLEGKFQGIGAEIGIKDETLHVIAPLPETPAARAGLLPGDLILMINGTSTEGMSVEQAVSMIRGPKGTQVNLKIGRIKSTFDLTITRETIVVKSVRVSYPATGIALIEVNHFNSDTKDLFRKAVDDAKSHGVRGIVLDLRSDPGGLLDQAIALGSYWVGDQVVVSEVRQDKVVDEFHGSGRASLQKIPTIVLVNEGSASASEILAGALQDYGYAKLVGTKTFGKGSVQDYMELADGSAIKITVAEWRTPKGRSINEIGITPDIVVERTEDDYHAERDPQLQKALELLGATPTPATSSTRP